MIRPQVDVAGDNVLAELQEKLKVRRGSSEPNPHNQTPPSGGQKMLGGIGKSTSLNEKQLYNVGINNSTSVGSSQPTTKWHMQSSSTPTNDKLDQVTTTAPIAIPGSGQKTVENNSSVASSNGSPLRPTTPRTTSKSLPKQSFGRIGPPPKMPPPQFDKSSHSSSNVSDKPQKRRPELSRSPPPPLRGKSVPLAKSPAGDFNSNVRPHPDSSKSPPASSREHTPPHGKPKKKTSIEKLSSSAGGAKKELKRLFGRNKGRVSSEPKDLLHRTTNVLTSELESDPAPVECPISIPSYGYQNVFEDEAFARFDRRRQIDSPEGTPSPNSSRTTKKPKPLPRKNSISSSAAHSTGMSDQESGNDRFHFSESESFTNQTQRTKWSTSSTEEEEYVESFIELESEIDRLADIAKLPPLSQSVTNRPVAGNVTSFEQKKQQLCKTLSHNPAANVPIKRRTTPKERKELRHGICSEGAQMDSDDDEYIAMNSIGMFDLTSSTLQLPTSNYPLDPRASGYYLKILPSNDSHAGGNRIKPPKPVSYAEFNRPNPIHTKDVKESLASPSTEFVESDSESENETDKQRSQPIHLTRQTKITSSDVNMMSSRHHPPVNKRTSNSLNGAQRFKVNNSKLKSGRTVHYSDVTVETSNDVKRKPSVPKKYRYQMVNLIKESKPVITAQNSENQPAPTLPQRSAPSKQVSKVPAQQNSTDSERIYYITSSSLTDQTGLTRPPPLTGSVPGRRAVWHEYVEIDEKEMDKKARNPTPNPPTQLSSSNASNAEINSVPPRASSTSSTDSQPYKVKPPEVPYRPDDLDKFVEHRSVSSGDYSYAAVPGLNLFGLQWLKFHARHFPNIPLAAQLSQSAPTKSEGVASSSPQTRSTKEKDSPPTLPPKTLSLLREQALVKEHVSEQRVEGARAAELPQPYLNFVTLSSGKKSASEPPLANILGKKDRSHQSQGVSLPTASFTSYVSDPNGLPTTPPGSVAGDKRHSPPPKPVPYKIIVNMKNSPPPKPQPYKPVQIKKQSLPVAMSDSSLQTSKSGTKLTTSVSSVSIQDVTVRELTSSDVRTRALTRTKAHRKLSRQRSYSAGQMSASMKRKPSMRHNKQNVSNVSVATESHDHKVTSETDEPVPVLPPKQKANPEQQVVQRRKVKRSGGFEKKIDRRSLAIILQNKDTISKHISQVCDIGTLEQNRQANLTTDRESQNEKIRNLGEILLEVDMLLRKKVCTESDLLSAIESQLNIKLQTVGDTPAEQNGSETQDLECDSTVEITDNDVEQVVKYVSDNRTESLENVNETVTHPYENQTYDVMSETQAGIGINHPYQNQVYGMKNGSVTDTKRQQSETDGYENVQDWTSSTDDSSCTSETLLLVPESKPRSRTFVEVNVDELEKQALSLTIQPMQSLPQSHDQSNSSANHYNVPRVRSKSNVTFSPIHQLSRPRLTTYNHSNNNSPSQYSTPFNAQPSSIQSQTQQFTNDSAMKQPAITVTSTSATRQLQLLHTNSSVDEDVSASNIVTTSYKLALQMEDDRFKTSHDPSHAQDILQASPTSTTNDGIETAGNTTEEIRDSRSYSTGQRPLRRVNARRRSSASNTADVATSTSFTNGTGVFTHRGGKLTNIGSGIEVEIPENAIPKGKKQKIWFDVVQTIVDPSNEEDMLNSLSDSGTYAYNCNSLLFRCMS